TTVVVGPGRATLATTSSSTLDGAAAVVTAQLGDGADGSSAKLEGHAVTFAAGASNCAATTDAAGLASCRLPSPPLGPQTVTASFAGDSRYTSANATGATIVYRVPTGGAFAVGDRSDTGAVTFW